MLGITEYKDRCYIHGENDFVQAKPEKLKVRKVSRASLRSLMYEGSDDANFNDKCGEMCQFSKKRRLP